MSKRGIGKFSLKHLYNPYLTSLDYWLRTFSFSSQQPGEVVTGDRVDSHTCTNTHTWKLFKYFILVLSFYLLDEGGPLLNFKQRHDGYNGFPSSVK